MNSAARFFALSRRKDEIMRHSIAVFFILAFAGSVVHGLKGTIDWMVVRRLAMARPTDPHNLAASAQIIDIFA